MMNKICNKVSGLFNKQKYHDNPKSYAYALSIYKLIWLFMIGSFAGYLIETGWYYMVRGHFINRQGLVIGPFSPIYGFAAVGITILAYKIRHINALNIIFIVGIFGGIFEYVCSILQEKVLGTRSWDYSYLPFNFNGRTCLKFMIIWGILGMIFIRNTYPYLSKYVEKIPDKIGKALALAIVIFMVFDCSLSLGATLRQKERREGIEAAGAVDNFFDSYYTDEKLAKIYTEIRIIDSKGNAIYIN